MISGLIAVLRFLVFRMLPAYVGACLFIFAMTYFAVGTFVFDAWPIVAILCVPLSGMIAASTMLPDVQSRN